ncbi:MAG: alpha/beta hydrolase [Ruminococcaceae bacterium]|jgi:alpha-beta hydrolase superfamily lysophospholipase|nr:alpha/beta hydrolase [Oscillospiraceae bacterium]
MQDFTFLSSDGKTSLHGMSWVPEGRDIIGVLQIAHGVAEHIARYDGFARFLNEQGIAVVGHDHLGHGQSVTANGTPVYFGDGNTWDTVVDDLYTLHLRIKERFPDAPLFLMGHSMGSFLARTYLIRYPGTVRAAIIMGTGWQNEATLAAGLAVAKIIINRSGEDAVSDLVTNLAFGSYNKAFAPNRTPVDWLSADSDNVDRYVADPLCGQPATVGLFRQMLTGIRFNQRGENLRKMDKDMPVLFISGEKDPVGSMMKGVIRSRDAFRSAGMRDVTLLSYAGLRHEILNEAAQQQTVYDDIWSWLKKYC